MTAWLEAAVLEAATRWWVLPLVTALCFVDGFIPVLPSESVIVALAAIIHEGRPFPLTALWAAGFLGAFLGDQVSYALGRSAGTERWRWMRLPRVRAAVAMARRNLGEHGALLLFTGRFIPGGRVAVNLTAGAIRYPWRRFVALDLASTMLWAAFSILLARLTSRWLHGQPLLQIAVSVLAAGALGLVLDRALKALLRRRGAVVE